MTHPDHPDDVVEVNFDNVPDASLLPEGKYLVRVKELVSKSTEAKDLMWNLRLEILHREDGSKTYAGRIVFDNLVFSEAGMSRIKLICGVLGIATKGRVSLKLSDFIGRSAWVEVAHRKDEKGKVWDGVPFRGWHPCQPDQAGPAGAPPTAQVAGSASAPQQAAPTPRRDDIPF